MSEPCYHCGDKIITSPIKFDEKVFCCSGCKTVYQLLSSNNLDAFYSLEKGAGVRPEKSNRHKYAFLEVPEIRPKFVDFEDEKSVRITFYLPKIHCSSCIYLLENIQKLEPAIQSCQVNFAKRVATVVFDKTKTTLVEIALLLDRIGYPPNFASQKDQNTKRNYTYLYKLGVAGFAFGSIMLWTFPEYLNIENDNPEFRSFTALLSFFVSIPVLVYSANEYFISAYKALKYKSINLDVPITIGIIALYAQSCHHIFAGLGPGYMDSFAGFIFFLLIGKWFQSKTYDSLSFERDYTSYFPVAITRLINGKTEIVEIDQLKIGDHILMRNEEIIPCDATLVSDEATIDYSFVTGESEHIEKKRNDFVYAGGKLSGKITEFEVVKESSRSHLTQLWNDASQAPNVNQHKSDKLSIYFLMILLSISGVSALFWSFHNLSRTTEVVVSILIVACPCALALSRPFTYGNIMRLLGRKGLYLKNTAVIEKLNDVDTIVFDKTGTLTKGSAEKIEYVGKILTPQEKSNVQHLANSSTHPLSRAIISFLNDKNEQVEPEELIHFNEVAGRGIEGDFNGINYKIGSARYTNSVHSDETELSVSYLVINGDLAGKFIFHSELREGIDELMKSIRSKYDVHILSGDKSKDRILMESLHIRPENICFEQTAQDKRNYVEQLNNNGARVLMLGDGLNDAGALDSAHVGIAVSEDVFRFTPSSDAILMATKLHRLNDLLLTSNYSKFVLRLCLAFSVMYNIVGLSFAISGNLTPLVAAILMPISSITVVAISSFSTLLKR